MNSKKTELVTFSTKALKNQLVHLNIVIAGEKIKSAPTYKYLGVTLDPLLSYSHHIATVKRNVQHKLYLFNKIKYNMPKTAAIKIVKSMILPIMDYCDVFYGIATKTNCHKLQLLQNRALKIAYRRQGITNIATLHRKAKLNKLKHRRQQHLWEIAFRKSLMDTKLDNRQIRTRVHDQRLLRVIKAKKPAYRKSLRYRLVEA